MSRRALRCPFVDIQTYLGLGLLVVQATLAVVLLCELWRTRAAGSIAVLSELAWMVAGIGWVIYGIWTRGYIVAVSGAMGAACCITVCLLIKHSITRSEWQRYFVLVGVFALAMIAAGALFGVAGLSVFLAVFGFVQFIPQLRLSAGQLLRGVVVAGVPVRGAAFRAVYTGLWCVYAVAWGIWGTAAIDWPLAVWGATGSVAFALQVAVGIRSRNALATQ